MNRHHWGAHELSCERWVTLGPIWRIAQGFGARVRQKAVAVWSGGAGRFRAVDFERSRGIDPCTARPSISSTAVPPPCAPGHVAPPRISPSLALLLGTLGAVLPEIVSPTAAGAATHPVTWNSGSDLWHL